LGQKLADSPWRSCGCCKFGSAEVADVVLELEVLAKQLGNISTLLTPQSLVFQDPSDIGDP
jgi:hypothetical protein